LNEKKKGILTFNFRREKEEEGEDIGNLKQRGKKKYGHENDKHLTFYS